MRISDWSSDVCSSDLHAWLPAWLSRRLGNAADAADLAHDAFIRLIDKPHRFDSAPEARGYGPTSFYLEQLDLSMNGIPNGILKVEKKKKPLTKQEIGRASCRESAW